MTTTPSRSDSVSIERFVADEIGTNGTAATDLETLRNAVVDAAGVGAGLWLSYIFVLLYLAIAAGGVTHRDLLLENAVKLPFLNVDLPLIGFVWLGPALLLVVHAYVLLHFSMLADKVALFRNELDGQIKLDPSKAQLRRELPSNVFVQIGAGPDEMQMGLKGLLLQMIAWISLVISPLAVLILFLFQFLPYHDVWASGWQRIMFALDLLLLWWLWPPIARVETTWLTRGELQSAKVVFTASVSLMVSAALVVLVFGVATFPGELLYENALPLSLQWLRKALVEGQVDFVTLKPTSVWSNRLVVPDIDVIDHTKFDTDAKIAALPQTVSLRGRRLEGAVFGSARLRKADFTGAHLQEAVFLRADLRGARFDCDEPTSEACADLRGASFYRAQLQGAYFDGAQLRGADFSRAQLQGASFNNAQLKGASLKEAQLQDTSFKNAQLQGVSFNKAKVQDTLFSGTLSDAQKADLGTLSEKQPSEDAETLGRRLLQAGCNGASAPYVLHGISHNLVGFFPEHSPQPAILAKTFLDVKQCPDGAIGLSERNKFDLQELIVASPSSITAH